MINFSIYKLHDDIKRQFCEPYLDIIRCCFVYFVFLSNIIIYFIRNQKVTKNLHMLVSKYVDCNLDYFTPLFICKFENTLFLLKNSENFL